MSKQANIDSKTEQSITIQSVVIKQNKISTKDRMILQTLSVLHDVLLHRRKAAMITSQNIKLQLIDSQVNHLKHLRRFLEESSQEPLLMEE